MFYVPWIAKNLVSISTLARDNNIYVEFHADFCLVKDNSTNMVVLNGVLKDGLYELNTVDKLDAAPSRFLGANSSTVLQSYSLNKIAEKDQLYTSVVLVVSPNLWHKRLGHPSPKVLGTIVKQRNLPIKANEKLLFCEAYQFGKARALSFQQSDSQASFTFDLVHIDLWGPAPILSTEGYQYYIHFLDDHSRFVWIYSLKLKSDTINAFQHFVTMVQTQYGKLVKCIQSDNGGEYTSVHKMYGQLGIQSRFFFPHTSAQNGRTEKKHRQIVETRLTLLAQASLPLQFWWDSFLNATMLINGLPTRVLHCKSHLELLIKKSLDISNLRVCGNACYTCLRAYQQHKFQYHTEKCIYLGPSPAYKGYKCITSTGRMYISRHVRFNEHEFPAATNFFYHTNTQPFQPSPNILLGFLHHLYLIPYHHSLYLPMPLPPLIILSHLTYT